MMPETVNAALLTVCDRTLEVLPVKLMLPPYTAVIERVAVAAEILLVVKEALPEAFSVPVPSVAPPSLKVTVPEGIPLAGATGPTVAVKVTDWPYRRGLIDDMVATVVLP